MTDLGEVRDRVLADWGEESLHYRLFQLLLDRLRPGAEGYLTLPLFVRWTEGDADTGQLAEAASYLAGERIGLLELRYQLVRDDDSVEEIDPQRVDEAYETGVLVDPTLGEAIGDWSKQVGVYFRGTPRLTALLAQEQP